MKEKKKKNEEHTDHHRWVISYADFITLLFAFFVVMYSISSLNTSKYRSLSEGMKSAFNKRDKARALKSTDNKKDGPQTKVSHGIYDDGLDKLDKSLSELEDGNFKINRHQGWIELDIKSGILFGSADAELTSEAIVKLMMLAQKIKDMDTVVSVEGYTDNIPIETPQYASNWELSAMRAATVARVLNTYGVATHRLLATGYGKQYPIADNATEFGRGLNRRVDIVLAVNRHVSRLLNPDADQIHSVVIGDEGIK